MIEKSSRIGLAFILLIGAAIFTYIIIKANVASFTIDESFSYLNYVHTSFMDIISFKNWYTNNHILNSLLMKYSEKLFGNSEISLRLPNLLLFGVYMAYSFLIFRKNNQLIVVGIFILLCTNNSIIDFFGLARGYGLSFGFMFMSLYHFVKSFEGQKTKHIMLFHAGALLATLSSFVMLNIYLILLVINNLMLILDSSFSERKTYNFFTSNRVHLIPVFLNSLILFEPIRRVTLNSNLDFGGKSGLYSDTISGLISYALHGLYISPVQLIFAEIIFTLIVLVPFVVIVLRFFKSDIDFLHRYKGLIITNFLIILLFVAIVLQHLIIKADYPISRFSLFILPIYIVHFGFLLGFLGHFHKKTAYTIILILPLLSGASFMFKVNTRSCSEWGYDSETKNMIQKLSEYHKSNSSQPEKISLGINWIFEPTINYYRQTKKLNWLLPVDRNGISTTHNFYYIFKEELNLLSPENQELIFEFDKTNTVLLKNLKMDISK